MSQKHLKCFSITFHFICGVNTNIKWLARELFYFCSLGQVTMSCCHCKLHWFTLFLFYQFFKYLSVSSVYSRAEHVIMVSHAHLTISKHDLHQSQWCFNTLFFVWFFLTVVFCLITFWVPAEQRWHSIEVIWRHLGVSVDHCVSRCTLQV